MKWATVTPVLLSLVLAPAVPVWAQDQQTRPAMTTFWGDTGLWFVPTGEVLPTGGLSLSAQRTEFDFRQGNTNVSDWPVTAAFGAGPLEIFGSLRVVTRIDRDTEPLLFAGPNNEAGGLVNEYPTVSESWTGNTLGDLYVGGKLNLLSQQRQQPMALAVRGTLKVPTGDKDVGAGTGEYDGFVDLIGSREFRGIELAGFGGVALRGDPAPLSLSDGIRWGGGAAFPARRSLRATAELYGEYMFDDAVTGPEGFLVGADGSLSPATSRLKDSINTAVGLTWQHPGGMLLGAALNYRFALEQSDPSSGTPPSTGGDAIGMEFRIGFHGGVRTFVPPPPAVALAPPPPPAAEPAPPPAPAPAPPPAPVANRPPVVRAVCNPCIVEPGQSAALRAERSDPDGDALTLRWTATGGTMADTRAGETTWRAETNAGLIIFNVSVEDGRGGVASDTVTIEVRAGEGLELEDVHFDFDSYTLRAEVLPMFEPMITALKERPGVRLAIEGHTCSIGTAEYNLALGERRAIAVRDYLVKRGIEATRLMTVSYGEERPAYDNAQESTRRLNRRAALIVRVADSDQ
jgi:outer membrane protein OmpA-like peptidoglycan-associated protein